MSHNSLPLAVTATNQNHCLLHTNSHTPLNVYTQIRVLYLAAHIVGMHVLVYTGLYLLGEAGGKLPPNSPASPPNGLPMIVHIK